MKNIIFNRFPIIPKKNITKPKVSVIVRRINSDEYDEKVAFVEDID